MEGRRKSTRASSRATSVDSKKSKNEKGKDQAATVDCEAAESLSSGSSMASCKVVLDRLSSASFNTRSRRKSNLTVDNLAAMDSTVQSKQTQPVESVASDETGISRTRSSARLSTSQKTPKKDKLSTSRVATIAAVAAVSAAAATATPTRRNSRLVESIDLTDSPVIPAKRALRSNSVASEDLPPGSPSTRRSTRSIRLADSHGTPNKSKVESEGVMTPGRKGRASRLFAKPVQEIKEEEEENESMDTVQMIDLSLDDDSNQSSPKPKSKKRGAAKTKTEKTSHAESDVSSKKMETEPIVTQSSEATVVLVRISTGNCGPIKLINSEPVKEANKSNDAIAESAAKEPSHDLNVTALVKTTVLDENATANASPSSEQTLPKEKSSVENKNAENTENDAIVVDESTLDHQRVDSISETSTLAEISKPQTETSVESALVIDEDADGTPGEANVTEQLFTTVKKTPVKKSPRADLEFMYQSAADHQLTPKQMKETSVSAMDPLTELVKPDTQVERPKTPKEGSPKPKTPSKSVDGFVEKDVTSPTDPSTPKSNTTEQLSAENSPKPDSSGDQSAAAQCETPNDDALMHSPKIVDDESNKSPSKCVSNDVDMTNLSDHPTTSIETASVNSALTPEQKGQATETANLNVTATVYSPNFKQNSDETVAIEKQSPKPKIPSKDATELFEKDITGLMDPETPTPERNKTQTPKKLSSKQNTPKSTPVSDKIATPGERTPKAKTPSKDLKEFEDMNVTKLVEEISVESVTPEKATETVSAPVPADTISAPLPDTEMKCANVSIPKTPSSIEKVATPKKSPLSSALADRSINLNLEISEICESLQSPNEKTEPKKPDIFAIPIDDGKILDDTVEPMEVDQTQIGNMTTTSIDEQPENQLDADNKNVSSMSVSSRKSVQIMTPKAAKNTLGLSRLGTPYPEKKEIDAALARDEEIKKATARFMGFVHDHQEKLKPLSESWNQSIKGRSTDEEGTSGIDKLNNKKDQTDEQPAKKAVPARNNWSVSIGLIDSDSEPELDHVPESENESEQSEEKSEHSGLIDDKAEAIDDYQSGDSEDEEDRQHREENEIKHKGIDLGSDDTDESQNEEEDSDDMDSFIVEDSDVDAHDSEPANSVQNVSVNRGRRFSRIVYEDTSSDDENEIVSVSLGMVQQEVVVSGRENQNSDRSPIVEGKKFETTIFKNNDEDNSAPKEPKTSNETAQVENESMAQSVEEASNDLSKSFKNAQEPEIMKDDQIEQESVQTDVIAPTEAELPKEEANAEEAQPTTEQTIEDITIAPRNEEKVSSILPIEPCDSKSDQNESVHESFESDISTTSLKENEATQINISKKRNRNTLPGIKALPDSPDEMAKRMNRKSLGNLISNQQALTVSPARVIHEEPIVPKKQTPKAAKPAKPQEPVSDKTTIESTEAEAEANTSAKSTDSKAVSSQEENNNKKAEKKSKDKKIVKKSETQPATPQTFDEQDNDAAVPCSSKSMLSVDSGGFKKSKKLKRKFVEVEMKVEPSTPPRKPVKYLNIIKSRSGQFIEETMTPEKEDKLGFKVTPLTPVNKAFRIEKLNSNETDHRVNKSKKRKLFQVEEPTIVLSKPQWTVDQDYVQPIKRARNIITGATEIIIRPLNEKKRIKRARDIIPVELQRFREGNLYRAGIPRQDLRLFLSDRLKRHASQKL